MSTSPENTILYVDDYAEIREATSAVLRRARFNVIEASTGRDALQKAAEQLPQLILLDIGLPDLDGYEVCRQIKSDPATQAIPVLLLSGAYTEGEDRVRGLEGGADAYLCKPVGSGELIATMKALLRMHAAEDRLRKLVDELADSTRRAEEASRLKDEFLSMVSHELRAPLNSIQGWTSLLRTGQLNPVETARALETIDKSAHAQNRIINDLLDVSSIVTGRFQLNLVPVSPTQVMEVALDTVRSAATAKGVALVADLERDAGMIYADAERLQQIFWNVLSNAVKFTPRGGHVTVELKRGGESLEIRVGDSGQGITPEFLPFVFDRFRQQDSSTTRAYSGLGLGLAIVRHLMELHGGAVRAESEGEKQGATFVLTFPLINEKDSALTEEVAAQAVQPDKFGENKIRDLLQRPSRRLQQVLQLAVPIQEEVTLPPVAMNR
jgi:signal transduction histidine kinase